MSTRVEELANRVAQVVGGVVRRVRVESTEQPFTWSQLSLFKRLETIGPATTADLARAEQMTPQAMGAVVAELEERGLLGRTEDAADGRRRLISLTRAATRALAESRAARRTWLATAIETHLNATEQRQLRDAMDLLERIASS